MQLDDAFLGQPDVTVNRRNRQLERVSQPISVMANTVSSLPFALQAALCSSIANFLSLKGYLGNNDAITSNLPSCYLLYVNMANSTQISTEKWDFCSRKISVGLTLSTASCD